MAVAAALRLYGLGGPSLTVDEGMGAYVAFLVPQSALQIPDIIRAISEVHPPGWFMALHEWAIVGRGEGWLRLSSAIPGILAVPLTLWLGVETRGSRKPLIAAGLLLATSAWHIQYSRELRMYPLLGIFVLLALAGFLRWANTGRGRWLVLFTLSAAAAQWVHYFGFFAVVLAGVWMARRRRDRVVGWLGGTLGAWLLFLPWLPTLLQQFQAQNLELRGPPGGLALIELLGRMTSADLFPAAAPGYLVLALIPLALVRRRASDYWLWLAIPPVAAWLVSTFTPARVFEFKYFVWCAPFLALAEGEALDPPRPWTRPLLSLLVLVHLAAWALMLFHPRAANQDWRAVAQEIETQMPEAALALVHPSMMAAPLLYYGVPPARMLPVDLPTEQSLEPLVGRTGVWLVTTPFHPLAEQVGLEAALDRRLARWRGRQRPAEGAWLPSAVTRVVRYRGEPSSPTEESPPPSPTGERQ